jgi:uncharacterized protein
MLKSSFVSFHKNWDKNKLPDPAESKFHGRWSQYAKQILEKRRHLSLIANITQTQIKRLEAAGIFTIDEVANIKLRSIPKISEDILEKIKSQAEMQIYLKIKTSLVIKFYLTIQKEILVFLYFLHILILTYFLT